MREYEFLSTWLMEVERERAFEALWDSERWPEWWPGVVEAVETEPGGEHGIGRRGHYEWRSTVPYPVRFEVTSTAVERPWLLAGEASGDLVGTGRWRLFEQNRICAVTYSWRVRPTKRWMRLLGPIGEPVLRWNHDRLMAAGARGLARSLGVRLIAAS